MTPMNSDSSSLPMAMTPDPEVAVLPVKKNHGIRDAIRFFPGHFALYLGYIIMIILLIPFSIFLILSGLYAEPGLFSGQQGGEAGLGGETITGTDMPWPLVEIFFRNGIFEIQATLPDTNITDQDQAYTGLYLLHIISLFTGVFCLLVIPVLIYIVVIYHKMMFAEKPWNSDEWNEVRQDADNRLQLSGVREEEVEDQENMMSKEQKDGMMKYMREEKIEIEEV